MKKRKRGFGSSEQFPPHTLKHSAIENLKRKGKLVRLTLKKRQNTTMREN